MHEELQKTLRERYPRIFPFAHPNRDPHAVSSFSGFECWDGWFDLLDALCLNLQAATDFRGSPQVVAVQVKEKFGALRFYTDVADAGQRGMIELAESMSARLCEKCGNRGELMSRKGWIMTRCPAHSGGDS
ncbi:hypothetical protein [Paraburkholderia sp. J10-1]|uniref:hypothetical protein n=1 Tax=Paraburkholderia sp. J10-1 TaxID=2805430 RepID=UPI002AB7AB8E|nr:hypothetical protein [Paraburkholderia sp. J10-1]